ncbi:hypothetical protein BG015_006961 [Linnemannia schmuckeri]|uniref:Oligopeptide transporter n=1 Tax=Linnemannia schmuckeri TaxID=64567 RepID=A0A9P5RZ50_9FUNG|nr:hypothetical protein BG015_006961 [Linnemannia schmuckeri]
MARVLPTSRWTVGNYFISFNPSPSNIKEHAPIGIAVSTAAPRHMLSRFCPLWIFSSITGSTPLAASSPSSPWVTYLVYPAEMVWWGNLVQVVFYNAMHNTDEFKAKRMFRGWSYTKYFWWCRTLLLGHLPIIWLNNVFNTKLYGHPLASGLYTLVGKPFKIGPLLNEDYSVNEERYLAGQPATMTPMYALVFMYPFIALAGCMSHIACFHGAEIWKTWNQSRASADEDIHVKMMKAYPEVPQIWYTTFYVVMVSLSCMVCEVYGLQLPWWGLLVGLAMNWILTFPIGAMTAITGTNPGVNVASELVYGFMFPEKLLANITFKCYAYMATWQCKELLSDLKLGVYIKISLRSMFTAQVWGTIVGGVFNYVTMILIINSKREYLDGTTDDPNGLWTGLGAQVLWSSALIYGAPGLQRMFSSKGNYYFIYWGFLISGVILVIQWGLSKKFPGIKWSLFNITISAGGMSAFLGGLIVGLVPSIVVFIVWQV